MTGARSTEGSAPAQSMNTVMDDNKMLTLASNERIPLTATMRLLLEINHMNHCSPATVSRGGVIYINAEDVGWRPVRHAVLRCTALCRLHALLALAQRHQKGCCMCPVPDLALRVPEIVPI